MKETQVNKWLSTIISWVGARVGPSQMLAKTVSRRNINHCPVRAISPNAHRNQP